MHSQSRTLDRVTKRNGMDGIKIAKTHKSGEENVQAVDAASVQKPPLGRKAHELD